jgi:hypothetical protein
VLLAAADEVLYGTIVTLLLFPGKETGRQFIQLAVIVETFAAEAFAGAWFVSAVANRTVLFYVIAVHDPGSSP